MAFKRWKMAYYYIYSTRMSAYVSTMQEDDKLSEDMKKAKAFMAKAAIFFDSAEQTFINGCDWKPSPRFKKQSNNLPHSTWCVSW